MNLLRVCLFQNRILLLALSTMLLLGCKNDREHELKSTEINRFECDIMNHGNFSHGDWNSFNGRYKDLLPLYSQSEFNENVCDSIIKSSIFKAFSDDVGKAFSSFDSIRHEIDEIHAAYSDFFDTEIFPKVVTDILPYNQSIIISDSTVIISLNHYLGADHELYEYFEEFIRKYKTKERIAIDFTEALIAAKIESGIKRSTVLDNMIYQGLIMNIMLAIIPDFDIYELIGYSSDEREWLQDNESAIWNALITKDVLYSSSPLDINGIIKPAPFCPIVSQQCPSQIGKWLGWKIIASYCRLNSDIKESYKYLQSTDSQTILIQSKYNGH